MDNARGLSAIVLNMVASMVLSFYDPILVLRMQDLGVNPNKVGLGFALQAFSFTIGSSLAGGLSKFVGKPCVMGCAMLMQGVAMVLLGLNSLPLTWTGLSMNGFFVSGVFILIIPEMMAATELSLKTRYKPLLTN